MNRKIIHVDMDAFFAAVEQRDHPELRGKPLIVGGPPNSRGVVATCSYEARKYGIHSAMPSSRAFQLCPHAVFIKPRIPAYRQVSQQIHEIFSHYTDLIEPLSLDEAYLDVTDSKLFKGSATLIAEDIRKRIVEETGLTASAGISYNKFLAKLATDINKPDGQFVIKPEDGEQFIEKLPIGKFYGIGKVTEAKMQSLGIYKGADLKARSLQELCNAFGKAGVYYYDIARAIDHRSVSSHRIRKSIGSETTFQQDLTCRDDMLLWLERLAQEVIAICRKKNILAYTLTIKVKYSDFQQITRCITVDEPLIEFQCIKPLLVLLLNKTDVDKRSVRLLGVTLSSLTTDAGAMHDVQLNLFEQERVHK
ncbi:MAG TPA: DNA polymerase IV [Gammaproteobacteria bacterium]